jgi:hypothetical protein
MILITDSTIKRGVIPVGNLLMKFFSSKKKSHKDTRLAKTGEGNGRKGGEGNG